MSIKTYIGKLPPETGRTEEVAIDLEIFEAEEHKLHKPTTGRFACLSFYIPSEEAVYIVTEQKDVKEALNRVRWSTWIFMNAKFDLTHLRRWATIKPRKKIWDIMLFEQILWHGYYDKFSLKDMVRRYLDAEMDKEVREDFATTNQLTPELLTYSAIDPYLTYLVQQEQKKIVTKKDMRLWMEIERPFLWCLLRTYPARLDVKKWEELAKENEAKAEGIREKLEFNPASPKQVKDILNKSGFKGIKSTGEAELRKWIAKKPDASEAVELAKTILEFRKAGKQASTYGMNIIEKYVENEYNDLYTLQSDWYQIGAETGRVASGDPNLMNIPAKDTLAFRECFIARKGNVLIIADFSQQEPRITAYISRDSRMIELFKSGEDIYCGMAKYVYKEEIDKHDPRRKKVKSTILGINYGMSKYGLAERESMTIDEAEQTIQDVLKPFVGLRKYMENQKKKKKYVETIFGRKIWLNQYSSQCYRNALNSPIQGTAADITKLSEIKFAELWDKSGISGIPYPVILRVHDELVLDVPEKMAEQTMQMLKDSMVWAGEYVCKGIPFAVDIKIAHNWAEGKLE